MPTLSALLLMSALSATAGAAQTIDLPLPQAPQQHVALHCIAPQRPNGEAVLFVHGASFPTMLAFGFEFAPGDSWMTFMAARGYLACGLDFLGFGASSRPPAMTQPADAGAPVTRAPEAAQQIALAVAWLRAQRHAGAVHLIAHSWGTVPAATFAAEHPLALASLTLFGPIVPTAESDPPTRKAWWSITAETRYQQLRFTDVLPHDLVLLEPSLAGRWAREFAATVPHVAGDAPDSLRIPAGPAADIATVQHGSYPYAASAVSVPVFVVYGDYDTVVNDAGAVAFLAKFTASPLKWRLRIDHGTHVMHLERNRHALYESVDAFIRTAGASAASATAQSASAP